jgi:hypothetical protein
MLQPMGSAGQHASCTKFWLVAESYTGGSPAISTALKQSALNAHNIRPTLRSSCVRLPDRKAGLPSSSTVWAAIRCSRSPSAMVWPGQACAAHNANDNAVRLQCTWAGQLHLRLSHWISSTAAPQRHLRSWSMNSALRCQVAYPATAHLQRNGLQCLTSHTSRLAPLLHQLHQVC